MSEYNKNKIESFTDLDAWKEGHKLVLAVYNSTKNFPKDEQFGLTSQVRRAVVSVTSCIAEGFSRHSPKDKLKFWYISLGSLTETQNQLLIARDLKYLLFKEFNELAGQTVKVSKIINGLIKSTQSRVPTHNS